MKTKPAWQSVPAETPLPEFVCGILGKLGHQDPGCWTNTLPAEAFQGDFESQRDCVNRALRGYIARSEQDTLTVRTFIADDGNREDWMRLFVNGVAPWMVAMDSAKRQ